MSKSSLFLQNITQIDFTRYYPRFCSFIGGSYQLNCVVTGEVIGSEQVVVDFSALKKTIKSLVDDREHGFDHKFWVREHFDEIEVKTSRDASIKENEYQLEADGFKAIVPKNSVRIISTDKTPLQCLRSYLQTELQKIYPEIGITIDVELTEEMFVPKNQRYSIIDFNYTHGLKNSTSWGCQNLNHGHYSWLSFSNENGDGIFLPHTTNSNIKHFLKNAIFLFEENIINIINNLTQYGYETQDRGRFFIQYNNREKNHNLIIMKKETTIENIADFLWDKFTSSEISSLRNFKIEKMFISEGLAKGSVVSKTIPD